MSVDEEQHDAGGGPGGPGAPKVLFRDERALIIREVIFLYHITNKD